MSVSAIDWWPVQGVPCILLPQLFKKHFCIMLGCLILDRICHLSNHTNNNSVKCFKIQWNQLLQDVRTIGCHTTTTQLSHYTSTSSNCVKFDSTVIPNPKEWKYKKAHWDSVPRMTKTCSPVDRLKCPIF